MLLFHRHVTILGRNANNGTNAGTFYWNLNNDSGNLNRNIGRQLAGTSVVKLSRKSGVHTQIVSPAVRSKAIETHGAHQQ
jgi:hypothetical protein